MVCIHNGQLHPSQWAAIPALALAAANRGQRLQLAKLPDQAKHGARSAIMLLAGLPSCQAARLHTSATLQLALGAPATMTCPVLAALLPQAASHRLWASSHGDREITVEESVISWFSTVVRSQVPRGTEKHRGCVRGHVASQRASIDCVNRNRGQITESPRSPKRLHGNWPYTTQACSSGGQNYLARRQACIAPIMHTAS
jgi:hypothetical protein